jgi:hypothetical protein
LGSASEMVEREPRVEFFSFFIKILAVKIIFIKVTQVKKNVKPAQEGLTFFQLTMGLFIELEPYKALRLAIALPSVTSSAYSRSPPTGSP